MPASGKINNVVYVSDLVPSPLTILIELIYFMSDLVFKSNTVVI